MAKSINLSMQQRERSTLAFNRRVLDEASDSSTPLLQRLRFIGIVSSNLDEFFRVRFGSLTNAYEAMQGEERTNYRKLMAAIQRDTEKLQNAIDNTTKTVLSELQDQGIVLKSERDITPEQQEWIEKYFFSHVLQYTDIIVDLQPASLNHYLQSEEMYLLACSKSNNPHALIRLPVTFLPRFVHLPEELNQSNKHTYVWLDDVIRKAAPKLFKNTPISDLYCLKCSRNAALSTDIDLLANIVDVWRERLAARDKGNIVRIVYDKAIPEKALATITKMQPVDGEIALIHGSRHHNKRDFINWADDINMPYLDKVEADPLEHPQFAIEGFGLPDLSQGDRLLHWPFHSFAYLLHMLQAATIDVDVKQISITLYRVATDSAIVWTLINALRNGKKVTVMLELGARFDENANLHWLESLSNAGATIVRGIDNYKVHAKILLIERHKKSAIAILSTGNFNEEAAKQYVDSTLCTENEAITKDVKTFFRFLTDPLPKHKFKHLLLSPRSLRTAIEELIDNEIANAKAKKPAYIYLKVNNLTDASLIEKLEKAAIKGVQIKLNVRTCFGLDPEQEKLKGRIEARSIVDNYLEHARYMIFANGGRPKCYLTSADWMKRNMDHRIEYAIPLLDKKMAQEIQKIVHMGFADNTKARILDKRQSNKIAQSSNASASTSGMQPPKLVRAQQSIYEYLAANAQAAASSIPPH